MHDMKTAQADDMIFKNKNATLRQDPDPRSGLSSVRARSNIHDICSIPIQSDFMTTTSIPCGN